jgi:hypothetical protein
VKIKSIRRSTDRGFRNTENYAARIKLHAGQQRRLPTTRRIRSYTLTTAVFPPPQWGRPPILAYVPICMPGHRARRTQPNHQPLNQPIDERGQLQSRSPQ